ncbi:hypothetical protein [Paenibacillus periandrae]|uniref:hypothetical protein n=1 Tax=Paenibacillus periandrae TaxID=1761741 RepID=UPI001F0984DF|nr:hypothetical protein [Paenibacillus periandrae]
MRNRILAPLIVLLLAAAVLTACNSTATPTPSPAPSAAMEPATLQGQSEHWKINVNYLVKDNALEEVPTIQYLSTVDVNEASVTITHKGQQPLTYQVINPDALKSGQAIELNGSSKVVSWKDIDKITVDWKVDTTKYAEYITPTLKTAAATP